MRARMLICAAAALVIAAVLSVSTSGQAPTRGTTEKPSSAARTPWGHPDLQGVYNVQTLTPLERPKESTGVLSLTKEDADRIAREERERVAARARPSDPNRPLPTAGRGVGGYNDFWMDRGQSGFVIDGQHRTSIIVDPADGRVPAQTTEAQQRNRRSRGTASLPTSDALENIQPDGEGAYDDIELRPYAERCILAFGSSSGPPILPNYAYNNLKQIVQTPNTVLLFIEMVHDARIVRLNSQHRPAHFRSWMGDSIGRWEGDTLVVETTNFTHKTRFRGSSENLKVTERIRRMDDNTLLYRFTVEDPSTWAQSWSGEYPWRRTDENIYEYACHEGNYAMGDIMRGERILDKDRAASKK
jgi:hypothetical protein